MCVENVKLRKIAHFLENKGNSCEMENGEFCDVNKHLEG
jgi:hypothetical protein